MNRVLLVDDHSSFREALALILGREPDVQVVAQADSLAQARQMLNDVDIAIVDINLPDGNGTDLVRDLHAANPDGIVLMLTGSSDRADFGRAVEAGAAGILHKSARLTDIIAAVRRLAAGEHLLSPREVIDLLQLVVREREQSREAQAALARLTPRERDVLQALADGLNDKQIALRLRIGTETVRTHMVNLLGKLGAESRLQALVFAIRNGAVKIR